MRIQDNRCQCGRLLTAEEMKYYGVNCEDCEQRYLQNKQDSGLPPSLRDPARVLDRGMKIVRLIEENPPFVLASMVLDLQAEVEAFKQQ